MSLINDKVSPVKLFEYRFFFNYHLIRSNTNIPLSWHHFITNKSSLMQNKVPYIRICWQDVRELKHQETILESFGLIHFRDRNAEAQRYFVVNYLDDMLILPLRKEKQRHPLNKYSIFNELEKRLSPEDDNYSSYHKGSKGHGQKELLSEYHTLTKLQALTNMIKWKKLNTHEWSQPFEITPMFPSLSSRDES